MAKAETIALWMRAQLAASPARGFVVGLNGSVDAAVVARLAQMAAPGAVAAVLIAYDSDGEAERHALAAAAHFTLPATRLDLAAACDALRAVLADADPAIRQRVRTSGAGIDSDGGRAALEDLKARLSMTALHALAASTGYLVAGTVDRSDLAIGRFTSHGEDASDLLPLAHLLKREVLELARELGLPAPLIDRSEGGRSVDPTANGVPSTMRREETTDFSEDVLERYLEGGPEAVAPAMAMRIERHLRSATKKRALAQTLTPEV
jgi:NAD+ synthase